MDRLVFFLLRRYLRKAGRYGKILRKINPMALQFLIILLLLALLFGILYRLLNSERKTLDDKARGEAPGSFIRLGKGPVHYELAGKEGNPTVVLIHGFSLPSYTWDHNFAALAEAGFQVLRFDLYGRGFSDRPQVDYDLKLFVGQVEELLAALKIDKPIHIVGLSMGGPIAAAYTGIHPEKTRSLTLIDPVVTNIFKPTAFPMNVPVLGELVMVFYLAPFQLAKAQTGDLHHPEAFPGWEARFKVQMQYKGFRRAILSTMRNLSRQDFTAVYRQAATANLPVLILRGAEDKTISAADIELLKTLIPRHRFALIEDAGHIPHYEKPQIVNPILIDFLRKPG